MQPGTAMTVKEIGPVRASSPASCPLIVGALVMVQTQETTDHLITQQFFAGRGLTAEPIPHKAGKTPDFRILRERQIVAFCEVKSPQDVFTERLRDAVIGAKGQLAGIIEVGHPSRQYRCLERAAKKAAAQFDAENAAHSVPNILMIVNHDAHSDVSDFLEVLTGYFGGRRVGNALRDEIPQIDAYLWIDTRTNSRTAEWIERIFRHGNPLKESVRGLLQLG